MTQTRPPDAPLQQPDCDAPEFVWGGQYWSICLRCGKPAWAHPQSDPLQDMRNTLRAAREGLPPGHFPPTMRKLS